MMDSTWTITEYGCGLVLPRRVHVVAPRTQGHAQARGGGGLLLFLLRHHLLPRTVVLDRVGPHLVRVRGWVRVRVSST